MSSIIKLAAAVVSAAFLSGCITPVRVSQQMSDQVRQMAEWRDTCSQYAAWVASIQTTNTADINKARELYITASASANCFIEQVQFDLIAGSAINETNYTKAEKSLQVSTSNFLAHAQQVTGTARKVRGPRGAIAVPLAISTITGLVDWGMKLRANLKTADMQQRQMIVKALEEKKWKTWSEVTK
jgi:outer membrane murein-binding lipoprotein Lpp